MSKKSSFIILIFMFIMSIILYGCGSESNTSDDSSKASGEADGSELKVGIKIEPPVLDPVISSAADVTYITRQVYETLVSYDENFEVVPMLAESFNVSDDNKNITFDLREDVKFHNGEEMQADDVVASMERWLKNAESAKPIKDEVTFEAIDDYTVELESEKGSVTTLETLAGMTQIPAIMPKDIVESAESDGVDEIIGTGPFKFEEWKNDEYVHLKKYDDYQPVDEPASGISGKKEALVDDLYFEFVEDSSTFLSGTKTGEYDVAYDIPLEYQEELESDPDLNAETQYNGFLSMYLNKDEGIFEDEKIRQAVETAINQEDILKSAYLSDYKVSPSYIIDENNDFYSESGSEYLEKQDIDEAKKLLDNSDYDGEEVQIITTHDYEEFYNASVVLEDELKEIGMQTKLVVQDWPTLVSTFREDSSGWDLYPVSSVQEYNPLDLLFLSEDFPDGPKDENVYELREEIRYAETEEEAQEKWDELQERLFKHAYIIKFGDFSMLNVTKENVEGFSDFGGPVLWNTKKGM